MARRSAARPLSLKARAIALLAQREHSAAELRRKLLRIARDRDRDRDRAAAEADAGPAGACEADRSSGEQGSGADVDADSKNDSKNDSDIDAASDLATEVDQLLAWLQSQGYLNEQRFVESRLHLRSQRFGGLRIKQELAQHGLSLSSEQEQALREGELGRARDVRSRKFGDAAPSEPADRARQSRFLAARGFSPETIRRALRPED